MQQLQISRGKLEIRAGHEPLLNGELFLDYTHGKKYDSSNLTYELYAGCNGEAIKIGGQGVLSFIRPTLPGEGLPSNPIKGGVYYITEDIQLGSSNTNSTGTDTPEFHAGDLAIYVGENYHLDTLPRPANDIFYRHMGTFHDDAPGWIRVGNGGGGTSYELTFNPNNTNLSSTNLQEAIVELDRNKLAFGGVKFKKNAAVDDVDLTNNRVYDTEDNANTTILASDLVASPYSIKAGYYYSVGELAAGKNVTIQMGNTADPTVDIVLEEGDFLAVTSSSTSTANALTLSDLNFTRIAGGTHDSARLNYSAGSRNDSYTNNSTNWDTRDSGVSNVKEALDLLFESKADLDEHGKIILAQLPDTLIQSMVFAGAYTYSGTAENFVLPTGTDKTNGEAELVQGDYFIYTGPQIKLEDTASTVSSNVRSSEGFINSGDWLVYEGHSKWSVIDNTSPITSIKVIDNYNSPAGEDVIDQSTIQSVVGEIKFEGAERGSTGLSEVQLDADDGETITIHNKDAALISDTNAASAGEFYKEAGNKTLKKTGVSETDDGLLTFDEARGVKITGGVEAASGVAGKTEGDPLSVSIAQNPEQSTEGDISLLLPAQSGTLATLEDIGNGSNFYIPRYKNDGTVAALVDSPVELIEHTSAGESSHLAGFKFHKSTGITGLQKDNSVIFRGSENNETELLHVMPGTSGYVLNSNSILDCGEWTDNGLVFEHEGGYNTYHNATLSTTSQDYREDIQANNTLDSETNENLDAVIINS